MKTITICGKKYDIDCNALTYVKYKSIFKTGILKDMQFIQNYLIKQVVVSNQLEDKKMSEAEKLIKVSEYMIDDTDEFITKITQLAWILIYTADNKIEDYETWLSHINFKVDDDWIAEVAEFAVDCFC
jgi:hypothetical protein